MVETDASLFGRHSLECTLPPFFAKSKADGAAVRPNLLELDLDDGEKRVALFLALATCLEAHRDSARNFAMVSCNSSPHGH